MAIYDLRNVYVIPCKVFGEPDFLGPAVPVGSVAVESSQFEPGLWGVFAPGAVLSAGNMRPFGESNQVGVSSSALYIATGGSNTLNGKAITLGLIYSGADRSAVAPTPDAQILGDGYFGISTTYNEGDAPQVFWAISGFAPDAPGAFWTNLVLTREEGVEAIEVPQSATEILHLPYTATLGSFADVQWYRVSLGLGTYIIDTADSPSPTDHDTFLALFDATGVLVAVNEDVGFEDWRSSITADVDAGDYYVALGPNGTKVGYGFAAVPGEYTVPAGTVLKVRRG